MANSSEATYGAASIGTAAGLIAAARQRRESILVQNNHASQDLYVGSNSSVTTSTGLHIVAGGSIRIESKATIYGIASGASTDVRYFEEF